MSCTWDFERWPDRPLSGCIRVCEVLDHLTVEIEYEDMGRLQIDVNDVDARQLRDWLSWYLDEGPEPGAAS